MEVEVLAELEEAKCLLCESREMNLSAFGCCSGKAEQVHLNK